MLKTFVSGIKMYLDRVVNQLRDEVGWKSESSEELFSETVTTVKGETGSSGSAQLSYTEAITADTLIVTFNGVEYVCPNLATSEDLESGVFGRYGAPVDIGSGTADFSDYPFLIISNDIGTGISNTFSTETPGTYTISATGVSVEYNADFEEAVKSLSPEVESLKYVKDSPDAKGGVIEGNVNTNTVTGQYSHAEGNSTTASGKNSHAEGNGTVANHAYQHVFGAYNIEDPSTKQSTSRGNYVEIVGNGTSKSDKKNARTLDWSGNERLAGSLTLGTGTTNETTVSAAQLKGLLNGDVPPEVAAQIENAQWKNDDRALLFTETVTAEEDEDQGIATFDYSEPITADTITVTLNGKEYVCPVSVDGSSMTYGAHYDSENTSFNFSEIPFAIDSNESGSNTFYVNEPGTYTVSVTTGAITYTDTFTNAVNDIAGWKAKELKELLSETVTTELDTVSSSAAFAKLSYSDPITADTIIVTFDGTEYVCQKDAVMDQNYYGDSSYTNPPFRIQSNQTEPYRNYVVTKAAGEHTVSIGVEVDACTDDFAKAVNEVAGWKTESTEQLFSETVTTARPSESAPVARGQLTYTGKITADPLIVTFNGEQYVCPSRTEVGVVYGADISSANHFSEFPFCIQVLQKDDDTFSNYIFTESPGTYTISTSADTITYTDTFVNAVKSIVGTGIKEVAEPDLADIAIITPNDSISMSVPLLNIASNGTITDGTKTIHFGSGEQIILYRNYTGGSAFFVGNESELSASSGNYYWNTKNNVTEANNVWTFIGSASIPTTDVNIKWYSLGLPHPTVQSK